VTALRYDEASGRWVLAAAVLGSAMVFVDGTVVNVALPRIGSSLGSGLGGLTWIVNGYTLTLAALILVGGSLGDRFGRRRVFVIGIAWFAVASLLCGLAPDIKTLVAARALQGIGGALLTPGSLAILQASFRPEDRPRAIGAWSGLAGIAGAAGPLVGGWLVDVASWRWIFLLNLPLALVAGVLAVRHVPETRDPDAATHVDVPGAALGAVGLGLLTYGLVAAQDTGLASTKTAGAITLGVVGLLAFVLRERAARDPMLPLGIFRSRMFSAANAFTFAIYAALGGVFFWLVLGLQVMARFSPLEAGLSLLPMTVLMLLLSARAGALASRVGARPLMTGGSVLCALGVAALTRVGGDARYAVDVLPGVLAFGLGLSLLVAPLTATVLAAVPDRHAGLASGVNNAVARIAGLLAVAVLPLIAGLGGNDYRSAAVMAPAYRTAMWCCVVLLLIGAVLAGIFLRSTGLWSRPQLRSCPLNAPPAVDATVRG
jgi:EmrB/QacA subfamily drug resistance transporter